MNKRHNTGMQFRGFITNYEINGFFSFYAENLPFYCFSQDPLKSRKRLQLAAFSDYWINFCYFSLLSQTFETIPA